MLLIPPRSLETVLFSFVVCAFHNSVLTTPKIPHQGNIEYNLAWSNEGKLSKRKSIKKTTTTTFISIK